MAQSCRLVLLTGYLAPYRVRLFQELHQRHPDLKILVTSANEPSRGWTVDAEDLPVVTQRSIVLRGKWNHPRFQERLSILIPYDTLWHLFRLLPDVVLSAEMGARTLQAAIYRWLMPGARLVIWATLSESTETGRGKAREFLRRVLLRSADAVIVNGASGARYIRKFNFDERRIFRAPQTTDLATFLQIPLHRHAEARRTLLYCGRLIELKGLMPFIDHLAGWARDNPNTAIEFNIAGSGPLSRAIQDYPCPPNLLLHVLGPRAYSDLPRVYGAAGILVLPTLADEWGLVVIEAMAAGIPVLGSLYSQAVEDLVEDGVNGWTFLPDAPESVRSALDKALLGPVSTVEQYGERARETVQSLTPANIAEKISNVADYAAAQNS